MTMEKAWPKKRVFKFSKPATEDLEILRFKNGFVLIRARIRNAEKNRQGYSTIYKLRTV
jgi:hypothetical protein